MLMNFLRAWDTTLWSLLLFLGSYLSNYHYYLNHHSTNNKPITLIRYGDVLALLGRELRDFLNGLDNLHEYLKFSYPRFVLFFKVTYSFVFLSRIRAPSYFVDQETPAGLMLHYRSKRRGFSTYTIGQLKAVAETYYKIELAIEIKESEIKFDTVHVSFQVLSSSFSFLESFSP